MQHFFMLFLMGSLILFDALASVNHLQAQSPWPLWVEVNVPVPPTPIRASGQAHLLYELHITNFDAGPLELTRIEVLGEEADALPLASYQDSELVGMIRRPSLAEITDARVIDVGLRAIVFVQLTFDSLGAVPNALHHRLYFKSNEVRGEERMLESTPVVVRRTPPLLIPPPLHGDGWLATSGFSNESGHRRSLLIVDGKMRIPQRYAIDWARVGSDGQLFHGDPTQNENWYAYGAEAVAVGNGVVVDILDGIPENVPLAESYATTITLATVGGNYVLLELGNHAYAFYGHLQPGSIRVKVGERVERGQVLGLVGNSGDSSGPHLHFHISDAPSPLGAEGLPYHFTSFEMQGIAESLELFHGGEGWQPEANQAVESHQREIPVQYAIVNFP